MADGREYLKPQKNNYPDFPNPRKTFVPLENNPETFAHLAKSLGISPELGFFDVYSVSESELLALIPRPVHALLFICPASIYWQCRAHEPSPNGGGEYEKTGVEEPAMWYKQTIGHSCGLMALLHAVSNGAGRQYLKSGSELETLIHAAEPLRWRPRADLLYQSPLLERAHANAATVGDTRAPDAAEPNDYHYICFVRGKDDHLYELEGGWDGPIDRGQLGSADDMLADRALNLGVRKMMEKADGNIEFSLVALA